MQKKVAYGAIILAAFSIALSGCAAIAIPDPAQIVSTPLGTESIKLGMSKQQVESIWGKPDNITSQEAKSSIY